MRSKSKKKNSKNKNKTQNLTEKSLNNDSPFITEVNTETLSQLVKQIEWLKGRRYVLTEKVKQLKKEEIIILNKQNEKKEKIKFIERKKCQRSMLPIWREYQRLIKQINKIDELKERLMDKQKDKDNKNYKNYAKLINFIKLAVYEQTDIMKRKETTENISFKLLKKKVECIIDEQNEVKEQRKLKKKEANEIIDKLKNIYNDLCKSKKKEKPNNENENKFKKLMEKIGQRIKKEADTVNIGKNQLLIHDIELMILNEIKEEKVDKKLTEVIEQMITNEINFKKEKDSNTPSTEKNLNLLNNEDKDLLQKINTEKKLIEEEEKKLLRKIKAERKLIEEEDNDILKTKKQLKEKIKEINIELNGKPKEATKKKARKSIKNDLLIKKNELLEEMKFIDNHRVNIQIERKNQLKNLKIKRAELLNEKQNLEKQKKKNVEKQNLQKQKKKNVEKQKKKKGVKESRKKYNKTKKELSETMVNILKEKIKEKDEKAQSNKAITKNSQKIILSDKEKIFLIKIVEILDEQNKLPDKMKEKELKLLEKEKILKDKIKSIENKKNIQYLRHIINEIIPLNELNSRLSQLLSRYNQLKTIKMDLVTKKISQKDQLYKYERELRDNTSCLQKLNKIHQQQKIPLQIENMGKNDCIFFETNNGNLKESTNESLTSITKKLRHYEEELKSLISTRKDYKRKLDSLVKIKYELKNKGIKENNVLNEKRNKLKDKLRELLIEKNQIYEQLIKASPNHQNTLKKREDQIECLQKVLEEEIELFSIRDKKILMQKRLNFLMEYEKQDMKIKKLLNKIKKAYCIYNKTENSVDKKNLNQTEETVVYSGKLYSLHALERMKERHISIAMVENAIISGGKILSHGCWNYFDPVSNIIVIVNKKNDTVMTTMKKNQKIGIDGSAFPIIYSKIRYVWERRHVLNDEIKERKNMGRIRRRNNLKKKKALKIRKSKNIMKKQNLYNYYYDDTYI